jgi:predicted ATPase
VLDQRFPETVETQPELLAQHYTEAGLIEQAIPYWQRAGQHASDRSAHLEAISHVTTGIELLTTLPETPERIQQSLRLHIALGAALQGQGEEGMAQVLRGIAAWRATGAVLLVPYFSTLLADVCGYRGHTAEGLQALAEAYTVIEQHEERWWEAEVCRLRGVLLLRQTGPEKAEAETWLQRALDVARHQEAKSLELRTAMSLARLWRQQGNRTKAYDLLVPIYGWFTEGFDTVDLQEAKALLAELG